MKKFTLSIFTLCMLASSLFADAFVFENKTSYPSKQTKSKMAIQWAQSALDTDHENTALLYGEEPGATLVVTKKGQLKMTSPKNAGYFRVLVWTEGNKTPDLLTNWVEITPNKTYVLDDDHLVPAVLISGFGC